MKIGKISGIDYRSLGVSEKIPFKSKSVSPLYARENEDEDVDLLSFVKPKKQKIRENLPEAGVVLTSFLVGGIILYKLFLGKKY